MRTLRTFIVYGLSSGLAFLMLGSSDTQGQLTLRLSDQPVQQSYYPSSTQDQYRQNVQVSYDEELAKPPHDGNPPSIQERASRLLQSQQSDNQINGEAGGMSSTPFLDGKRTSNVGFRRLQQRDPVATNQDQDPFGEDQAKVKPVPKNNLVDPFADPPSDEPKQEPKDPFGEGQVQPKIEPANQPAVTPSDSNATKPQDVPNNIQKPAQEPFSNPLAEEPKRDPVVPDDAQFNQLPAKPEKRDGPGAVDSAIRQPGEIDLAPRNTNRDPQPNRPVYAKPPKQTPYRGRIQRDSSMDYLKGAPLKESAPSAVELKRQRPAENVPPIVQRDQYAPYKAPQPIYQPPVTRSQLYKPDYQPIPALPPQSTYTAPSPAPPNSYAPSNAQPGMVLNSPDLSSVIVNPSNEVYSPVIGVGNNACNTPRSNPLAGDFNCQTCGSQCQSRGSNCRTCGTGCPNFYFSVFGGATGLRDLEGRSGTRGISADSGGGVGIALGRRNGRNLRTEAEFSYRHNFLSGFDTDPVPSNQPVDGDFNSFAGMANAYWEFIDVPIKCFKPYIGAGVGFVSVDAEIRDALGQNMVPAGVQHDTSFAFQWMAGLNYKAYRNMDLFAEYRMFKADTFSLDSSVPGLGDRYTFETDNVFMGLRWKF